MAARKLILSLLTGFHVVYRLRVADGFTPWAEGEGLRSITRTADELSMVCRQKRAPEVIASERDRH